MPSVVKTYTCAQYPQLLVAHVGQFVNGTLELSDPSLIEKLEQTDSFKEGRIREYIPAADEIVRLPHKTDVVKMTKQQLVSFAEEYGIEDVSMTSKRSELVDAALEFLSEAEAAESEV